nr:immunoglobulin heavy chain junction region [Macaca mulatta]MOX91556.1 immunoglobulin heavy chain junction region [Macaca mulatta]MOX95264.1 immunoglobulin heavy chain junction region [Macaca mulatta]
CARDVTGSGLDFW